MKVQRASEGQRYGDTNRQHAQAVDHVIYFWNNYSHPKYANWIIDKNWVEQYSPQFIKENPDRTKDHFFHVADLSFYEWCIDQPVLQLCIEIDGESHESPIRQIADKQFEKWIAEHYRYRVKVIRLQKSELVGPPHLALEYFLDKL